MEGKKPKRADARWCPGCDAETLPTHRGCPWCETPLLELGIPERASMPPTDSMIELPSLLASRQLALAL